MIGQLRIEITSPSSSDEQSLMLIKAIKEETKALIKSQFLKSNTQIALLYQIYRIDILGYVRKFKSGRECLVLNGPPGEQ